MFTVVTPHALPGALTHPRRKENWIPRSRDCVRIYFCPCKHAIVGRVTPRGETNIAGSGDPAYIIFPPLDITTQSPSPGVTREKLDSHVPANHDKSWIGGIVPPDFDSFNRGAICNPL